MPSRLRRTRTKGSKLPHDCVCVTRPSKWGNPYSSAHDFRCALVALQSDRYLHPRLEKGRQHMLRIIDSIQELRGKDLACWCKIGAPCHADVLIEFANDL
jgi:hypothetical protein